MKTQISIFAIAMGFLCACQPAPENKYPVRNGPYFGQLPPGNKLELLAPGIVSTGLDESVITFMPDGKECYWTIVFSGYESILTSRLENNRWTDPKLVSFAGKYYDGWPAIQPDGKRMLFHSSRPNPDSTNGIKAKFNLWYVDRIPGGWSEPKIFGIPVNGIENSTCPSVTISGTIYLSKRFSDGIEKLCRSAFVNGTYQELEVLPDNVNVSKYNYHGYISPDESYLIRPVGGRPDAINGAWNFYVSFRNSQGQWSDLINLGKEVNSLYCAGAQAISPDGKCLFFQARTQAEVVYGMEKKYSLRELIDRENRNPANGSADIYCIDAGIIDALKPKNQP
jgi:hypothetical protein